MRIGVVTTSYPRFRGDPAGGFVAELSEWIAARGHEVEVVAAGDGAAEGSWQMLPVHRVSVAPGLFYQGGAPDALGQRGAAWAAARFSAALSLAVRRRAQEWDGIVAHWLAPSALAAAVVAPKIPLWAIAHGGDVHLLRKLRLTPVAEHLLSRPSVHLNFVSRALQQSFAASAGKRSRGLMHRSSIEPMGIDLDHFRNLAKTREANSKPLLLFLGRLVPIKGVDILLRSLAAACADIQVIIAGAGPEERSLRSLAKELGLDVAWAGEVHGSARDALLARANVVAIPSRPFEGREEGMPRIALEALAAGAELLVTDSGGLVEIPESICHRVVSCDVDGLSAALKKLARGAKAPRGAGHWLENRGWDVLAPRLLPGLGVEH
ncbi:MAG: glycosyltransferase family 4 protein [Myxococcales bacterium]|nr:glycosyltransferase family 4 protein [Myxococcales bacterium]